MTRRDFYVCEIGFKPADFALVSGVSRTLHPRGVQVQAVTLAASDWDSLRARLAQAASGQRPQGVRKASWARVAGVSRAEWVSLHDRIVDAVDAQVEWGRKRGLIFTDEQMVGRVPS